MRPRCASRCPGRMPPGSRPPRPSRPCGGAGGKRESRNRAAASVSEARRSRRASPSPGRGSRCAAPDGSRCARRGRRRSSPPPPAPSGAGRRRRSSRAGTSCPSLSPAARARQSVRRSSWWSSGQSCDSQPNPTQVHRGDRLLHHQPGHDRSRRQGGRRDLTRTISSVDLHLVRSGFPLTGTCVRR